MAILKKDLFLGSSPPDYAKPFLEMKFLVHDYMYWLAKWPSDLAFKREIQKGTLPHMLIHHNSQNWWIGLKYKTLNIPRIKL